jgi:hypothetical protein
LVSDIGRIPNSFYAVTSELVRNHAQIVCGKSDDWYESHIEHSAKLGHDEVQNSCDAKEAGRNI